jgi:hypothetical protein
MKQIKPIIDLSSVNPSGRLDVLLYRGAEYLTKQIESRNGLTGMWDNLQPHVNTAVVNALDGFKIPTELKVLLSMIQANWNKVEQGKTE